MNDLNRFLKALSFASLFVAASALADGVPCGQISSGDLSFPGLSLHVTDASGNPASDVTASGKISIFHSVWDGDHWGSQEDTIPLSVSFQSNSQTYAVDAVSGVSLGSSGIFGNCQDVVETYEVDFTNSAGVGQFQIRFQNDSLSDARTRTRISQAVLNTTVVIYPAGQQSPAQASDANELNIFVNQLMPYQAKAISDWTWSDLIPFVNLEVENALARFARVLRIGAMGTSGNDDFQNLNQICSYFSVGSPAHAPDLAQALEPFTTDSFASQVQTKNSNDQMSDLLTKMIPICEAAVKRNSN